MKDNAMPYSTPEDVCQHSSCATGQGAFVSAKTLARWHDFAADLMKRAGVDRSEIIGEMYDAAVSPSPAHAGICEPDKLHAAIMNIPCKVPDGYPFGSELCSGVYRQAHRDARHAAAELVSAAASPDVGKAQAPSPIPPARQWLDDNCCAAPKDWVDGWTACRTFAMSAAIAQSAPRPDLLEAGKEDQR